MLSVIIVNYKTPELLYDCILSINENPPECEYEIIVADNNSGDGSERVSDIPYVTYLALPKNGGFSYANNKGLEKAKGDIILFLNPDTFVLKGTLLACINELLSDKDLGCVGCRLLMENGRLDLACKRGFPTLKNSFFKFTGIDKLLPSPFFSGYNLLHLNEEEKHYVDCVVGAFMMIPRAVLEEVGSFDERFFMYGEDIDLCYRIKNAGYKILYDGTHTIFHRKRASSKKSSVAKKAFYDSMWLYYDKHFSKKHGKIVSGIVKLSIKTLEKLKG
ncbi:MAG: glycosyltransferase family 2 protein [Clostridia bacterium]|nr:glycosyltransferase family 2 protein [Clostridia bacterium]